MCATFNVYRRFLMLIFIAIYVIHFLIELIFVKL